MNQPREPHPLTRLVAVTSRTQAAERLLRQARAVVTGTKTVLVPAPAQADAEAARELARLIR